MTLIEQFKNETHKQKLSEYITWLENKFNTQVIDTINEYYKQVKYGNLRKVESFKKWYKDTKLLT